MDFSKALDKVPYNGLFGKVRSHGIQGELADCIELAPWKQAEGDGGRLLYGLEARD